MINRSIAWLYDPKNRAEAVEMMVEVSKMQADDVEKSYDFLIGGKLFEPTGKVSKAKLDKPWSMRCASSATSRADFAVERLFLPGVTQLTD